MRQIIKNASVFSLRYVPSEIKYRDREFKELSWRMNKPLEGEPVKNTAVFGLSGTGKTLVSKYLADELPAKCPDVKTCYVRLKGARSEFLALTQVTQALMNEEYKGRGSPSIYNRIFSYIKELNEKYIVFILDEIDSVTQGLDNFLDAFLRPYEKSNGIIGDKEVSVIFITNNNKFPHHAEKLSVGTISSYKTTDYLIFDKYDANQLRSILTDRAENGLHPGTYGDSVIPLCAALAAQDHGDARQAIEFLEKAAMIAEKDGVPKIEEKHVRLAQELREFEGVAEGLKTQTTQGKAVALALVIDLIKRDKMPKSKVLLDNIPTTVSVYNEYKNIVQGLGLEVVTVRRVHDILIEFETQGIINSQVLSKGRAMGRSRHVELIVPSLTIARVIANDFRFKDYNWVLYELEKRERPTIMQTVLGEASWKRPED